MNLCDKCETVSHCSKHGCIPLAECINSGQVSATQVVAHAGARELPELPKAEWLWSVGPTHTSDQMRAYAAAAATAIAAQQEEIVRLRALLTRYRNETPLGNQPHMIAHEVDTILNPNQGAKT